MRELFKFHLFSFKFMDQSLKYTLFFQSDSNNLSIYLIFFFSQFYAKESDYQFSGSAPVLYLNGRKIKFCEYGEFKGCHIGKQLMQIGRLAWPSLNTVRGRIYGARL